MSTAEIIENLLLYCDAQDNATAILRNELKKLAKSEETDSREEPTTPEQVFTCLNWRDETGAKLGAYQITLDNQNDAEKWGKAFKILEEKKAVINKRFHEESYQFAYWLYDRMPYKIFRQKLKEPSK